MQKKKKKLQMKLRITGKFNKQAKVYDKSVVDITILKDSPPFNFGKKGLWLPKRTKYTKLAKISISGSAT
jgi:hypothetical protein